MERRDQLWTISRKMFRRTVLPSALLRRAEADATTGRTLADREDKRLAMLGALEGRWSWCPAGESEQALLTERWEGVEESLARMVVGGVGFGVEDLGGVDPLTGSDEEERFMIECPVVVMVVS